MARRKRRSFTAEFKAEAVAKVKEGLSVAQVAQDLDLTESTRDTEVPGKSGGVASLADTDGDIDALGD